MPGETLQETLAATETLQQQGTAAILTHLGENASQMETADGVTQQYLDVLEEVTARGLDAQISVKLTQLGLDLDRDRCLANLTSLAERAASKGSFVWIDMESSRYVDVTLDLFRRVHERIGRVGVCLQACLRRTRSDLESLLPLGPAIRLVKGAYMEPSERAFRHRREVDESFFDLATCLLDERNRRPSSFLGIATHDARLVARLQGHLDGHDVPSGSHEFEMLYGIGRPLRRQLRSEGHPVRVLISYGEYWFPWFMRRLAERPANLWFVVKSVFEG